MSDKLLIPSDTWGAAPWHRARLDLRGFMVQNRHLMSGENIEFARWLYGSEYQCRHHSPPWSTVSPDYVEYIYHWINERRSEIEARKIAA